MPEGRLNGRYLLGGALNSTCDGLAIWPYPINGLQRVPPSDLVDYFATHQARGPSCLCASQKAASHTLNKYTEAAVFRVQNGRPGVNGKWVFACRDGICRYWIIIDNIWFRPGLTIKRYPLRALNDLAEPPIEFRPLGGEEAFFADIPDTGTPPPVLAGTRRPREEDSSDDDELVT
ncbi:hypothetical protein HGRIS_004170 [Hohenbuehelia grisea]|uniref:Uncharacterized protein n=1 Tax=Hohenbuehelia grisea TaxID=104357 RepID=A0ABR3JHP3_9AGAR